MINAGEGGFLCTDDDEIAARAICYAGCYELLYEQHMVAPPADVFERVKFETPNYSLRMSDLTASCVRPQIDDLEERIAKVSPPAEQLRVDVELCVLPNCISLRTRTLRVWCVASTLMWPLASPSQYNERYAAIVARLEDSPHIDVPPLDPRVRPVCDSLQFNLVGMNAEQAAYRPL